MTDHLPERRVWFEQYLQRMGQGVVHPPADGISYTCPCCGYPTLGERGGYEICPICYGEDDGQDDPRAAEIWGGPNGDFSLAEARENFRKHLIMYRPDDKEAFQREIHLQRMLRKRELIDRWEAAGGAEP